MQSDRSCLSTKTCECTALCTAGQARHACPAPPCHAVMLHRLYCSVAIPGCSLATGCTARSGSLFLTPPQLAGPQPSLCWCSSGFFRCGWPGAKASRAARSPSLRLLLPLRLAGPQPALPNHHPEVVKALGVDQPCRSQGRWAGRKVAGRNGASADGRQLAKAAAAGGPKRPSPGQGPTPGAPPRCLLSPRGVHPCTCLPGCRPAAPGWPRSAPWPARPAARTASPARLQKEQSGAQMRCVQSQGAPHVPSSCSHGFTGSSAKDKATDGKQFQGKWKSGRGTAQGAAARWEVSRHCAVLLTASGGVPPLAPPVTKRTGIPLSQSSASSKKAAKHEWHPSAFACTCTSAWPKKGKEATKQPNMRAHPHPPPPSGCRSSPAPRLPAPAPSTRRPPPPWPAARTPAPVRRGMEWMLHAWRGATQVAARAAAAGGKAGASPAPGSSHAGTHVPGCCSLRGRCNGAAAGCLLALARVRTASSPRGLPGTSASRWASPAHAVGRPPPAHTTSG